jgi:hypothetical protein
MLREPLTLTQARSFASWIALSGSLNLVSEWLPGLPAERLDCLKKSMPNTGLTARPIDLFQNMPAQAWHLSNGKRNVVGLFNWDPSKPASVCTTTKDLGLAECQAGYAGLDYWSGKLVPIPGGAVKMELPASGCSILSVAPVLSQPQLLGTSRHITQCFVDVGDSRWKQTTLSGNCKLVGGDPTELRILTASTQGNWTAVEAEVTRKDRECGVTVSIQHETNLVRVRLSAPKNRDVRWSVRFNPEPAPGPGLQTENR